MGRLQHLWCLLTPSRASLIAMRSKTQLAGGELVARGAQHRDGKVRSWHKRLLKGSAWKLLFFLLFLHFQQAE